MKEIGIYVHIPFCKRKCYYCDFCSYADKLGLQQRYVDAVIQEINQIKNSNEYRVNTIYIGGGTPSIIDADLIKKIVDKIKNHFSVLDDAEITMEINPGTVDELKVQKYKSAGINRISIGLQSASNRLLESVGRIHKYEDFEVAYEMFIKNGFSNINVDLMIGLPGQSIEDVEDTLVKIIEKDPKHISVYSLIIEPGTIMEKLINSGKLELPNEDEERKMYWLVKDILKQNGYEQYEISNFAKSGFESKHNSNCWNQNEYIGIGCAAHSYMDKVRYSNKENVEEYIRNIESGQYSNNMIVQENQEKEDMMKEYMILGLRKIEGVDVNKFMKKFNSNPLDIFKDEIEKMEKIGLLNVSNNENESSIKLTKRGIDFANIVWEEFV